MNEKANSNFRPEIQGLRAIAVLSVFLFHMYPQIFTGGYVGVDVFFVISGYLMTGILFREFTTTGTISLSKFYARRIRRLLPASTVVLLAVALLIFLLPSVRWPDTAKEIISSSFYVQNWWLSANTVDYWARDSSPSVLMHYWSLAIEEQYYIFWPILFLLVIGFLKLTSKAIPHIFTIVIILICLSSFAWSIYFTHQNQTLAYYSTFTRIWEMAAGGLLLIVTPNLKYLNKFVKIILGWVGFCLILLACYKFTPLTAFPGYMALLPVVGTILVIIGGEVSGLSSVQNFLSYKFFQYFGGISYSLYLWHWPVIILYSFSGFQKGTGLDVKDAVCIFCLTIVLAHLSKKVIEDPFRNKKSFLYKHLNSFTILTFSLAITLLGANYIWIKYEQKTNRVDFSSVQLSEKTLALLLNEDHDFLLPLIPELAKAYRDRPQLYWLGKDTLFNESDVRPYDFGSQSAYTYHIALVGDSLTAQFTPALERIAEENAGLRFTVFTKSACAFLKSAQKFGVRKNLAENEACVKWNQDMLAELAELKPDLIIMGIKREIGYIDISDSEERLRLAVNDYLQTWNELTARGSKVLVVAETPVMEHNIVECLSAPGANIKKCTTSRSKALPKDKLLSQVMVKNENPDVYFWDPGDLICNEKECLPIRGQVLVYRDKMHLTKTFVRLIAPDLAEILQNEFGIPVTLN